MCGRYAFSRVDQQLIERLGLEGGLPEELEARWNIAPGQAAAALRSEAGVRRLELLRWGLPNPARPGSLLINARAETAATLPAFHEAFAAGSCEAGRCLLPCEGWFEWRRVGRLRQPWFIRPAAGETALLAGLWRESPEGLGRVFSILTCAAAAPIAWLHPRMPVVLPETLWSDWLRGRGGAVDWAPRLAPWPAELLDGWEVGPEVNSIAADHAGLIAPASAVQGSLF